MKFGPVPVSQALGKILAHKLFDSDGKKRLNKGHTLNAEDIALIKALGHDEVIVADLEEADLHEDLAAKRVGDALSGPGVRVKAPGVGRANLIATDTGPIRLNVPALQRLNNIDEGVTIATLREHTLVNPGDLIALVKVIPFGVLSARVVDIEAVARESTPVLSVRPLIPRDVALIISGPESAKERLTESYEAPVRHRIEQLKSRLRPPVFTTHTPQALAKAIESAADSDLIIMVGISAIIDRADVAPTALQLAGGAVAHFGVPVDPGSLLMLGYLNDTPVLGAPGCIKSPKVNVVDLILPRLIAGERLTRADLVALGHGGLLDDIRDRPMPRDS